MRWIAVLAVVVAGLLAYWGLSDKTGARRHGAEREVPPPAERSAPVAEPEPPQESTPPGLPLRVVDDQDRPIEGSTVVGYFPEDVGGYWGLREGRSARTDAQGRCGLPLQGASPWIQVVASHPAFVRQREWIRRRAGEQEIVMRRGAPLTVVVLAPDRSPLKGAAVVALQDVKHGAYGFYHWDESNELGEAKTDAEGRAVLGAVPATVVTLRVDHPSYAVKALDLSVEGDAPIEHIVVLDTGAVITGRLLDAAGKPVPGGHVELVGHDRPKAVSAADGTYRLEQVGAGSAQLVAHADGHGPGFFGAALGWGEPVPIAVKTGALLTGFDITLGKPTWITGQLVDDDGKPVAGAQVHPWCDRGYQRDAAVETDAEGRFRAGPLSLLEPTKVGIWVSAAAYSVPASPETVAKPGEDVHFEKITATRLGEVRGRVVDADGNPVSASVFAAPPNRRVRSDAEGRFVCKGLRPGKVFLQARLPGATVQKSPRTEFEIAAGEVKLGVELRLQKTASIKGRVVTKAGAPQPNVQIEAVDAAGRKDIESSRSDGTFEFGHLLPGRYRVGPDDGAAPAVEVEAGADDLEFVVTSSGAVVTGRVVARTGRPVREFTLTLIRYQLLLPRGSSVQIFDVADGRFRMEVAKPGSHALDVSAARFASHRTAKFSLADGAVKDLGTIRLGDGGRLTGVVRDAQGRPVPYARINILNTKFQTNPDEPFTDEEGRYALDGISPGVYTIFAVSPSHPLGMVRAVRIREGKRTEADVALLDAAPLTVAVVDGGGRPVEGAQLSFTFKTIAPLTSKLFRDKIPPGYGSHKSDAAGLIRQRSLPPGEVTITIEAEGFRPRTKKVRLKQGEANRIEIRLRAKD